MGKGGCIAQAPSIQGERITEEDEGHLTLEDTPRKLSATGPAAAKREVELGS